MEEGINLTMNYINVNEKGHLADLCTFTQNQILPDTCLCIIRLRYTSQISRKKELQGKRYMKRKKN